MFTYTAAPQGILFTGKTGSRRVKTRGRGLAGFFGRGTRIRTGDLLHPKQAHYQAVLYPVICLAVFSELRRRCHAKSPARAHYACSVTYR